ncbi:MAG TPA: alpha/beta fold hydrolase [Candidatus Acidoferrales bacterium]|nr:alpha/beta fold hydrolase [Candidatus Acidoferrales bacterium]
MAFMPGAEPFELPGADAGVLLMHGFSGSCSEIRALGRTLNEAGYGVFAPALAGHGTSPRDLLDVGPEDFFASADAAYREVRQRYGRVYVVGLSLGGTLGLHLATRYPLDGIVTISAPVFMSPLVSWSVPFAKRWMPERNVISNYSAWRGEVVGYRTTPISSIAVFMDVLAAVKDELSRVSVPVLLLHSTGDQTVPVANARYIASRVASADKAVRVYRGGRHLLTLPPYLDTVQTDVIRFLHSREAPYVTGSHAMSKGASL